MTLILHLSDLHFRKRMLNEVDEKTQIELAAFETLLDRAKSTIRSLPRRPDFVIVSGDIRYRNDADSFTLFNEFCDELIGAEALPGVDHFMIVPGNHDVERVSHFEAIDEPARWKAFAGGIERFPHAWIPSVHPKGDMIKAAERTLSDHYAGGASREEQERLGRTKVIGLPFLFDPQAGVLIYGFNSAAISGTRVTLPKNVQRAITWLDDWQEPNADKWRTVREFLDQRIRIDPAQVRPDELELFHQITDMLGKKYGEAYEKATKIAVLHHHVAPMPAQEVKDFELLLNASDFKRETAAAGFSIICHGHKHRPFAFRDAAEPAGAGQVVVAGGTVGGETPREVSPGFYLIEIDNAAARTEFVSITPGRAANKDERHWELPVAGGTPPVKHSRPPRLNVGRITAAAVQAVAAAARERTLDSGVAIEGWAHKAGEPVVTATSTAFALRLLGLSHPLPAGGMRLVSQGLAALTALRYETGGWSSRYEAKRGTPESTGWVALGLHGWGERVPQEELEAVLRQLLDAQDTGRSRTFSIAHATIVLAAIHPDSSLIPQFVEILDRGAIRREGAVVGWSLRLGDGDFSAVHTAYACIALLRAAGDRNPTIDLTAARDALLTQAWQARADEIEGGSTRTEGRLLIKHYPQATVVRALLELGVEPLHESIVKAVTDIAAAQHEGLWRWPDDNTKPLWMTYEAVAALHAWARSF